MEHTYSKLTKGHRPDLDRDRQFKSKLSPTKPGAKVTGRLLLFRPLRGSRTLSLRRSGIRRNKATT